MIRHKQKIIMPEIAKQLSGFGHRGLATVVVTALLLVPQVLQAQPCTGTTVSPASPRDTVISCDAGVTTLDIIGNLGGTGGTQLNSDDNDETSITLSGVGTAIVNIAEGEEFGALYGGISSTSYIFGSDITVNNAADSGGWAFFGDATQFGGGDDTINNAGLIMPASGPSPFGSASTGLERVFYETTMSFGGGQDVFNNAGVLLVGDTRFRFTTLTSGPGGQFNFEFGALLPQSDGRGVASRAAFEGLEEFNNTGLIVLGGFAYRGGTGGFTNLPVPEGLGPRFYVSSERGEAYCRSALTGLGAPNPPPGGFVCTDSVTIGDTDRLVNDVLYMPGTLFTGSGASAIMLDAEFGNGVPQTNCLNESRKNDRDFFRLPGADCVDLRGGETAGSTQIIVRDAYPGDQGTYNPEGIVIVDVGGGISAAEHFTLSPLSDDYTTTDTGRGVVDQGLFVFPLVYDESTQQHKLVGIPGAAALQLPLLAHSAQDISRQVTASGIDERQHSLRAALRADGKPRGGFWGNFSHQTAERDAAQTVFASGESFTFNNDFERDSTTLMMGRDFVTSTAGDGAGLWGGSVGYVRSDLTFDQNPNEAVFEGVALTLYAGFETGAWFVNGAFSRTFMELDHFVPTYNLTTAGSGVDTDVETQGAWLEGGHRIALLENLHVEPLASLSWNKANIDDFDVSSPDNPLATANRVKFDDSTSLRSGLGARLSLDTKLLGWKVGYMLTGRVWNEADADASAMIQSNFSDEDVTVTDTQLDAATFTELQGSIGVSNADDSVSGFLNIDSSSSDDYDSFGAELGFRYQW